MTKLGKITKISVLLAALTVFSGCEVKRQTGQPTENAPAVVSAEKNSFQAVTAKLDAGGCVYGYLSTEEWLQGLSGKMSEYRGMLDLIPNLNEDNKRNLNTVCDLVTNLTKISGIEEISGVGLSSVARQTNLYYNKIIIHHYRGNDKGFIWSAFGKKAHPLASLDMLPEKTALAAFGDADLPLLWSTVHDELVRLNVPEMSRQLDQFPEQFEKVTHLKLDEVLSSFGGEYGVVLTLDEGKMVGIPQNGGQTMLEIPNPALALVIKVKNDLIFDAVNKNMNGSQVIKVDNSNVKMRTQPLPLPLPVEIRPTIARSGDYLILASTDSLVKEMVDVKTGKKNGLKSTKEFKNLSQGVPLEGNRYVFNSRVFASTAAALQKNALNKQPEAQLEQKQWLTKLISSGSECSFYVGVQTEEGKETIGNASSSLTKAVLVPAVVIPATAAAVAVPNFMKARQAAQANADAGQNQKPTEQK